MSVQRSKGFFSPAIRCSPDEKSGAVAAVGLINSI